MDRTHPYYLAFRAWQNHALDGVGCHSSAKPLWADFDRLDQMSDAKLTEAAREARARGLHYIADLIDEGLFLDHQERKRLSRIRRLFDETALACREIVAAIGAVFSGSGARA